MSSSLASHSSRKPTDHKTGTIRTPNYYDGPAYINGDVRVRGRYFAYRNDTGLVAGAAVSALFTIERPAKDVWLYFKDFNLWQNTFSHYYSGVIGNIEGGTFSLSEKPNDTQHPHRYKVVRVIPEALIVISQDTPEDGTKTSHVPGLGLVSPGFHTFMLSEHANQTTLAIHTEHASVMEVGSHDMSDNQAIAPWQDETTMLPAWVAKWHKDFIPYLKKLVLERSSSGSM